MLRAVAPSVLTSPHSTAYGSSGLLLSCSMETVNICGAATRKPSHFEMPGGHWIPTCRPATSMPDTEVDTCAQSS
jgi:hypothetical protein